MSAIQFRQMSATESKAIKSQLKADGVTGVKIQLKNGRAYAYGINESNKAILRDILVLSDYVNACGESFTLPSTRICEGMPICALA